MTRRYFVTVSQDHRTQQFTCHIYRYGQLVSKADGGTANNAVRLAKALL